MKHYIIIEVREREFEGRLISDMALIRKNLHEFVTTNGINAADCVVREDRTHLHSSMWENKWTSESNPYKEAQSLFRKAMGGRWRNRKDRLVDEAETCWDPKFNEGRT